MVAMKSSAMGLLGLAFCAFGIQLGAIAALNHMTCDSDSSAAYRTLGTNVDSEMPSSTNATRGLRSVNPSPSEWKARCSFFYSMEWCVAWGFTELVPETLYTVMHS